MEIYDDIISEIENTVKTFVKYDGENHPVFYKKKLTEFDGDMNIEIAFVPFCETKDKLNFAFGITKEMIEDPNKEGLKRIVRDHIKYEIINVLESKHPGIFDKIKC